MRQKELRIALICYGGISLAVYMHGVTKEVWKAVRASQLHWDGQAVPTGGTEAVYDGLLRHLEEAHALKLRVLADIVAGASAGGINSVFLAQAIHSGQSLEPLTELWLECADVDVLLDPDARPWSKAAKFWVFPLVQFLLNRPGNAVTASVAPETRAEVRAKLSRLIRSRWFEPPFGGLGFSRLLCRALDAMRHSPASSPLLPAGHPIDLFVTATDFKGHLETLRLHSPEVLLESEHRLSIGFRAATPVVGGEMLASPLELVFAARATASFPGAFPALQVSEIDALALEHGTAWPGRDSFLRRVMPEHAAREDLDGVALIDGSVLVNAPFAEAMSVLRDRPAHREVDRRFVYIDPTPHRLTRSERKDPNRPGFFSVIFGSLSAIPRTQPIRDNLEELQRQSEEMAKLRTIVEALRPEVEETVEALFGRTLFFDRPTAKRLMAWRAKAQNAAIGQSGFAYHGYAQIKFSGVINALAHLIHVAAPARDGGEDTIARRLSAHLAASGLERMTALRGGSTESAIRFFRDHDIDFRIRRLRLLARRLTREWEDSDRFTHEERDRIRTTIYKALSLYLQCQTTECLGEDFPDVAARVIDDPAAVLDHISAHRRLGEADVKVDELLAEELAAMPPDVRRRMLLTYLGFPFYDTATLPLLRGEGLTEFDPVKIDRIAPDDARSIRGGGAGATLRGIEFYNFGAFFSRAYRENDYLWGRLHGAERMIDLIVSTLPADRSIDEQVLRAAKKAAFLAILDEEETRLTTDPGLVRTIRDEVMGLT
ncbi:MAG TPA: patatin-like protein [Novosphingobium sp.]|nr:patatin-like protein [Novosphingobium sp.]